MRESNLVEKIKAACMACAIPVLLYLAFAISVYGDTVDANGNNFPVPVLADPASRFVTEGSRSEARESTKQVSDLGASAHKEHSRGGENNLSGALNAVARSFDACPSAQNLPPAELYARLIDERYIPWTEPAILKGNSFADRLRESQ